MTRNLYRLSLDLLLSSCSILHKHTPYTCTAHVHPRHDENYYFSLIARMSFLWACSWDPYSTSVTHTHTHTRATSGWELSDQCHWYEMRGADLKVLHRSLRQCECPRDGYRREWAHWSRHWCQSQVLQLLFSWCLLRTSVWWVWLIAFSVCVCVHVVCICAWCVYSRIVCYCTAVWIAHIRG